jgi:hypothetical protein
MGGEQVGLLRWIETPDIPVRVRNRPLGSVYHLVMLVRELVDALSAMNQDLQVMVEHDEEGLLLLERIEVKPAFGSGDPRVSDVTEVVVLGENVLDYRADRNVKSPGTYSK